MSGRPLRREEKHRLVLLGLPTAALALAITIVTSYLPVVARGMIPSSTVVGVLIGIEGVMALWVPLVVGTWSDRLRTPLGGRLPFLVAGTPVMAAALVVMSAAPSELVIGLAVALFFFAYFVAYEPYRAMYPDLLDDDVAGRAQSTQAVWRGAGTGLALVGGGLLVAVAEPLPFVVAAGVVVVAMAAFVWIARGRAGARDTPAGGGTSPRELLGLLRESPPLRAFLAANALWEASLSALKTFAFLFIIAGIGLSEPAAAAIIGGVALVALAAAPVAGKLGDRMGRAALMARVVPFYGAGLLVPAFTQEPVVLVPLLVVVGFGGGLVMTLPYAILQPLMPEDHHGALTGFYSVSRGIGAALGPLAAGVAIQVLAGPFGSTEGYAAMWLVCGATVLLSIWPLRRLRET